MAQVMQPKLARASFRGVSFTCTAHDLRAGRRIADHIFPQRDLGYHEDMGRQDREVSLTAYLNGDDSAAQRDRLLVAVEAAGPGELFHPWLGRMMVVVRSATVRESRNQRRHVEITLTFVEAGTAAVMTPLIDTVAPLRTAVTALTTAAEAALARRFDLRRAAGFVKQDAQLVFGEAAVGGEVIRLNTPGHAARGYAVTQAIDAVARLGTQGPVLAGEIARSLGGMMALLAEVSPDPRRGVENFTEAFQDFGAALPAIPLTTSNRRRQQQNRSVLTDIVRMLGLGGAVGLAARIPFQDYSDAVTGRSRIADWCDAEAATASQARDDDSFGAITGLRTAFVDHVTAGMGTLARARNVTLPTAMPSLVAAHRLYGDARRGVDLAVRNRRVLPQGHPGLLPPQVALSMTEV